MGPRRGTMLSSQQQQQQDSLAPNVSSFSQPRSASPSSNFTHFLTKPSKWFSRSVSASKAPSTIPEPRPSISSARKHKISHPTDPRPILDNHAGGASRSVLDLSTRTQGSVELSRLHNPSSPSSPTSKSFTAGLGDLKNISKKAWSKSADDLSKVSTTEFSPVKASFQERIVEYRNRSRSNASSITPVGIINGRHPFPTSSTPPSSSPPRNIILPSVSISISAPAIDNPTISTQTSPTHVNNRSQSFTSKLPPRLPVPRPSPSPQGTPPNSNDRDHDPRDRIISSPSRVVLGFGLGTQNHNKSIPDPNAISPPVSHRATTLLPPPSMILSLQNQEVEEKSDMKRSSQIVYNSGFINRLGDAPNNFHQANSFLSKGWKPYKVELKGSKLYFYKPPGDRAAAVKDLFPTGLVPPSEQDMDEIDSESRNEASDDATPRKTKPKEEGAGTIGRKKRAFWGRKTHPDLIMNPSGIIEKGTFESLVHEAVFATTFLHSKAEEQNVDNRKRWHEFASSVLFSVPSIVGRQAFELEFTRCCSYLVSGLDDEIKDVQRSHVTWLANEYLTYHGQPVDATAWDQWKQETIPGVSLSAEAATFSSSLPVSTSTQAVYHPSPLIGNSSPNINTFSPRPEDSPKTLPLLDALFPASYPPSHEQQQQSHSLRPILVSSIRFPWAALNEDGLTRDLLFLLDPYLIAHSLTLYHRSVLDQCPENLTAEFIITSQEDSNEENEHASPSSPNPLFGSEDRPHWLTKLLLLQILGADSSAGHNSSNPFASPSSPGRRSEDRSGGQTSRTHSRSEVISVWAKVGELCRIAGDECSWQAISAALCSRAISRLDKAWKRVDPQALSAIESWAHVTSGETIAVGQPQVTPWGGAVKVHVAEELGKARGENGDSMIVMECIVKARSLFDEFRTSFLLCPRRTYVTENEVSEDARRMVVFWREMAADGGGVSSTAVKFQRLEQFMSLSLAAEPRRKGLFEPYFWTRSNHVHTSYTSLIPLLFPDPLPTLTLVDRSKLVRGRLESDASEMQHLRSVDAQLRQEAGRKLHNLDENQDYVKRLILGSGGTVISLYNGDLRLVVQSGVFESETSSRPSSHALSRPPSSVVDHGSEKNLGRNPSIRVKPSTSQGLDRKTSIARRSSLPSVSLLSRQNFVTSEPSPDPPLRVLVQAGTLNNLVNVLVHGLENIYVSVADDNGEMSLREGMKREVVIDRAEFARVWWNVFRSFISPLMFFELLRKSYTTAQPAGSSPPASDYLLVVRIRNEVLVTIQEWLTIGGGGQDILDDVQLFNSIQSFLEIQTEHQFMVKSEDIPIMEQAWETLVETKRSLKLSFMSQTMRPTISRGFHNSRPHHHHHHHQGNGNRGARTRNVSTRDPPDLDRMDPEDFVDNLDGMAGAAFSNVTQEDLYITADLLEVQTSDRTGWFSSRDVGSTEESVEIQTFYSHIQEIEPSSMISELTQDALYRLLPPGVRSCIRAYGIIRKWLISKIVAPRLGLRARQARMELLIQAIEVSRLRNLESSTSTAPQVDQQPCIRSFVEAVTTSALLSVESRMHHRAWQSVALSRGCSCDSLSSLLLRPYIRCTSSTDSLTVDMGWLLERMLEVIATPDIIETSFQDGQHLVNFDKRRHLCNLINKSSSLTSGRKNIYSDESNRRGFERLNNIEREVLTLQFDHRGIKEEAIREAANPGMNGAPPPTKKAIRPFHKVVAIQIEKNRRDKSLRIRLQREKLQEQSKIERRDDLFNKAMRPRKQPLSNVQKQHRNKKSMSAFLSFMRPISSAFGAETPQQSLALKRTPSELDFPLTSKPSLVLSVMDAQVAQFINNERSYTFQLDTDDGGHYLLQAMTKREMNKWLETISRVTKMAAKRRLTYLGHSPKPQISDHIHSAPIVASRDPKAVFGVELEFLLRRETGSEHVPMGTVPTIIEQCLTEVESRGLSEVGIYRIAGATTEINFLKDAYNRGEYPLRESTDIHAICDLVKSWFRVLPEPVFPPDSYHDVMDAMKLDNLDERLLNIRRVVQGLPQANFDILRRVSEHLDKVTDYEEHNHMTAEALAIVFSPNLLRAPQNDFVMILNNMGHSHKLVKALITHFHVIFDEADPEGDVPSEDELESPIPEENEDELEEEEEEHEEQEEAQASYNFSHEPSDNGTQYTLN